MSRKYITNPLLLLFTIISLFTLPFLGCNQGVKSDNREKKPIITVTIEPQRYFLYQIVGDNFEINTLVPPGTSPETYEPAPSVLVNMSNSDLYFIVGDLGFEQAWSKRIAENNPRLKIVDCSQGIDLIEGEEHHHTDGHGHTYSHSSLDQHIWSSPSTVKLMIENMLNALVEFDSENEDRYRSNYNNFIDKIDSIDTVITELLIDIPTRSFVIFHPSLGYFAKDYDLHQHSIEFEGKSPSPSQIRKLIDIAKKENINTVFIEKGYDVKNAQVVAQEIGAEIFEISPLDYEWEIEMINIAEILSRDKKLK